MSLFIQCLLSGVSSFGGYFYLQSQMHFYAKSEWYFQLVNTNSPPLVLAEDIILDFGTLNFGIPLKTFFLQVPGSAKSVWSKYRDTRQMKRFNGTKRGSSGLSRVALRFPQLRARDLIRAQASGESGF